MIKICEECKKEFEASNNRKKFCSSICKSRYHDKNREKREYTVICDNCGKEYVSSVNKTDSHPLCFCSKSCSIEYHKKNYTAICEVCGKEFEQASVGHKCCSRKCAEESKRKKTAKVCKNCRKIFFSNTTTNFCSKECKQKFNSIKTEKNKCEYCGKEFMGTKIQKYCSTKCKQSYLRNENREMAICENCGKEYVRNKKYNDCQHSFCSHKCCMEWEYRNKIICPRFSGEHKLVNDFLDELGIKYENEKQYSVYCADIYLINYNKIIEVMGSYWHGEARRYTLEKLNEDLKQCIEKDKRKKDFIKDKYDVEILYLWEYDINENKELCQLLILKFIKGQLNNLHSSHYYLNNDILLENNIYQYMEIINKSP